MDVKTIAGYGRRRIKLFLNNNFIYTGYINKIIGNTVIFIDKYNKKIPIDAECIDLINDMEE